MKRIYPMATTETYKINKWILIDIVTNPEEETYTAWMYHIPLGDKKCVVGTGFGAHSSTDSFTEFVKENLKDYVHDYVRECFTRRDFTAEAIKRFRKEWLAIEY